MSTTERISETSEVIYGDAGIDLLKNILDGLNPIHGTGMCDRA